ncbi:MAG: Hpt domain-containing protein, partial [Desulfovibrionales bacterium]
MNQDFFDPEIFADFVLEAKEHLETIEPMLLELEKDPENLDVLNEIFRPMHSLKGASGFLGLNAINGLAHKAENIMDELRKGNIRVTSEIMDTILNATDCLSGMVGNLEESGQEGDVETSGIIARIDSLLDGSEGGEPIETEEPSVPAPSGETGKTAYSLTVSGDDLLPDFLEEAFDRVGELNRALLSLEEVSGREQLIDDLCKSFQHLKENSSRLGYRELCDLAQEAGNLLHGVRTADEAPSGDLVDALLAATDQVEKLLSGIDPETGDVLPDDPSEVIDRIRSVSQIRESAPDIQPQKKEQSLPAPPSDVDPEDLHIFDQTVRQQFEILSKGLESLRHDASDMEAVDRIYEALVAVQNSAEYMAFDEIGTSAERTAGLVDQGRSSDLDFSLMTDILEQETDILKDMTTDKLEELKSCVQESSPPK